MTRLRFGSLLALGALVALAVILGLRSAENSAQAIPQGTVDLVALDMNTAGNDDSAVGSIEQCASIAAVGQQLTLDLVVKGVDPADRIAAYQFDIDYNPAIISVAAVVDIDAKGSVAPTDVTMISRINSTGGTGFLPLGDWLTNPASMTLAAADLTANAPAGSWPAMHEPALANDGIDDDGDTVVDNAGEASPDGVLARVTVTGIAPGVSPLTIPSVVGGADGIVDATVVDRNSVPIPITSLRSGEVFVGAPCPPPTPMPTPAVQRFILTDLVGAVDPVTYTDADGAFTTSEITLALNPSSHSTASFDPSTNLIASHLVADVSFNNGKPGALNEDLFGTFTIEESGEFLSPHDPFCLQFPDSIGCAELIITDGTLNHAGPFAGTKAKGKNPTWFPGDQSTRKRCVDDHDPGGIVIIAWRFSEPGSPPQLLLDLPSPPFVGGEDTVVHGEATSCLVSGVGGTTELLVGGPDAPRGAVGGSSPPAPYAALAAAGVAGVLAVAAGGWYVRRRLS